MLGLKPIKLLPARERVASALRKAIIAQQIKEGETLTLETTAQQLGVSITPVREAFQILERDGLISLQQNRGATVLGINEKTLREHYQVRAVLEKAACELCCENGADLSSVKNCIDTAEEALERNDVTDYANQNQSFHYEIWKAAGNGKLEKMLGELWNGLSLGLNSTEEEYARRSQKEHQQIYAALAMVTSGTVPYENANGAATILPAALAILPKPVYYAFVVGGPIMAILTTLNSSIASFRFQPTQAAKDGWLPKAILKENRFGMPPIQLLFMLIMLLIPIVFNVSIVTINYISQIIMFGLGIATLIGIARIPKLYPEAWKKNSFHMSKTALWISVLLSATLYTINFVKAVIVLEPIYAVIAVVAMVVALVLGKVIADRGGLHIETSVWPPKSE